MKRSTQQRGGAALIAALIWAGAVCGPALGQDPAATDAPAERPMLAGTVAIEGEIDGFTASAFEALVDAALEKQPKVLILELNTPGGEIEAAEAIAKRIIALNDAGIETVAWVRGRALSAGTLLALACKRIAMEKESRIGDALPIQIGLDLEGLDIRVAEKILEPWRASFELYAERRGYPVPLARAMVDPQHPGIVKVWVKVGADSQVQYMSQPEWEGLSEYDREAVMRFEEVVRPGRILTLNDEQAADHGFAWKAGIDSREALCSELAASMKVAKVEAFAPQGMWWLGVLKVLSWTWVKVLLFAAGAIAMFVALNTPGTGAAEVLTVLCFAAVFGSSYMVGLAGVIELVIFALGVALIAMEIFVIPGFGVTGILGIGCVLASFLLTMQSFILPTTGAEWDVFVTNLVWTAGAFALVLAGLGAAIRLLPQSRLLGGLVHSSAQASGEAARVAGASAADAESLIGQRAVVHAALRPSGEIALAGEIIDAVSEEALIEKGVEVEVIGRRGFSVLVRTLPKALSNQEDGLYLERDSQAREEASS